MNKTQKEILEEIYKELDNYRVECAMIGMRFAVEEPTMEPKYLSSPEVIKISDKIESLIIQLTKK